MVSLKIKIFIALLAMCFIYLVILAIMAIDQAFPVVMLMLTSIFRRPTLVFSPDFFWVFVVLVVLIAIWAFVFYKLSRSIYDRFKVSVESAETLNKLQKEKKSLKIFQDVAQKEFLKRKISKTTYSDIERMTGKKLVEIKAKERELIDPKKKKELEEQVQ